MSLKQECVKQRKGMVQSDQCTADHAAVVPPLLLLLQTWRNAAERLAKHRSLMPAPECSGLAVNEGA
jgi:hypothetical protein